MKSGLLSSIVFFLWSVGFIFIVPSIIQGQGMGMMMDREGMKAMMKRMMPDQLPPGVDPESLPEPDSTGAKLLRRYCAQCHDLPSPRMHSAEEWRGVYQRMNDRMKMMSIGGMMGGMTRTETPDLKEEKVLLAYLQRHGLRAAVPNQISGLDSPEGMLFRQTCSQCHALPDPKQHTAQEWPGVVARMKGNMALMRKPVILTKEEQVIVEFLQKATSQ